MQCSCFICCSFVRCADGNTPVCWATPAEITSALLKYLITYLITSMTTYLTIHKPLKYHFATNKTRRQPAGCWTKNTPPTATVSNIISINTVRTSVSLSKRVFIRVCVSLQVKPNTPCCLVASRDPERWNFTWESTYEKYSQYTSLAENLMYQLHYYKQEGEDNVNMHNSVSSFTWLLWQQSFKWAPPPNQVPSIFYEIH